MRKVFVGLLLVVALYACHKDAEPVADVAVVAVVDGGVDLADAMTAVDAADAVSAADVPSPVTP